MSEEIEFLLAIIVVIFMTANFMTDFHVFVQIAATVALVNFIVSTIRCTEQRSIDKKGGEEL